MQKRYVRTGVCPSWQVSNGYKMKLGASSPGTLLLCCSAAELLVEPEKGHRNPHWMVSWKLNHGHGEVAGFIRLNTEGLERAFGVKDGLGGGAQELIARTGTVLDAAEQGCFVRWGQWLNIPHPGTGLQGDPNISIELDDHIIAAIRALLETRMQLV